MYVDKEVEQNILFFKTNYDANKKKYYQLREKIELNRRLSLKNDQLIKIGKLDKWSHF